MSVLAQINTHFDELKEEPLLVETARAMVLAYAINYEQQDRDIVVRGIEVPFTFELPVPDDMPEALKPKTPRYVNGVIDHIYERGGQLYAGDLKTASWVSDMYWRELYTNEQLGTYALAGLVLGLGNLEWEWDVISKPTIKPSKLTKADVADIESGVYCGWPTECKVPEDGKESPKLYGIRLLQWYLDKPTEKFQRRTYQRNESEILKSIWWWHYKLYQAELAAQRGGDLNLLHCLQNQSACTSYGELCEYHNICAGFDVDKSTYQTREKREGSNDLGVSVSQIRCFNSCQAKWWFKYQERIEPRTKPSNWNTRLGSAVHAGREVYLGTRLVDPIVFPVLSSGVVPEAANG